MLYLYLAILLQTKEIAGSGLVKHRHESLEARSDCWAMLCVVSSVYFTRPPQPQPQRLAPLVDVPPSRVCDFADGSAQGKSTYTRKYCTWIFTRTSTAAWMDGHMKPVVYCTQTL